MIKKERKRGREEYGAREPNEREPVLREMKRKREEEEGDGEKTRKRKRWRTTKGSVDLCAAE